VARMGEETKVYKDLREIGWVELSGFSWVCIRAGGGLL
jgi:tRNA splicing endonuclease